LRLERACSTTARPSERVREREPRALAPARQPWAAPLLALAAEGSDAGVSFKSTCYSRTAIETVMSNTSEDAWPIAEAIDRLFEQHERT
jgi:hypothetical protein